MDFAKPLPFLTLAAAAPLPIGSYLTLVPCRVPGQQQLARLLTGMGRGQNVCKVEGYTELAKKVFPLVTHRITHDLLGLS